MSSSNADSKGGEPTPAAQPESPDAKSIKLGAINAAFHKAEISYATSTSLSSRCMEFIKQLESGEKKNIDEIIMAVNFWIDFDEGHLNDLKALLAAIKSATRSINGSTHVKVPSALAEAANKLTVAKLQVQGVHCRMLCEFVHDFPGTDDAMRLQLLTDATRTYETREKVLEIGDLIAIELFERDNVEPST